MYYIKKFKKKVIDYLFDHPFQRDALESTRNFLITLLSGFVFAFGFKCFIQPNYNAIALLNTQAESLVNEITIKSLASSGASGICQVLLAILKIFGCTFLIDNTLKDITYWALYFAVNLPLLIMAFVKIGKRFAIFTMLNVLTASFFGIILPNSEPTDFINKITLNLGNEIVARVFFGALCTGLASALAYSIDTSAGGIDIIAFYISERKSVQVGKWSAFFNVIIVSIFSILNCVPLDPVFATHQMGAIDVSAALVIFLFTLLYMLSCTIVIDTINIQNKKVELQIITTNPNLSKIILANVPHGCTILNAQGGYTGKQMYIIYMSVRKKEGKHVVKICRRMDPSVFINVMPMDQVYGSFFRKPIR